MTTPYDVAIVGGGPGGYVAAIRAASLGARVALVEKDRIGGTCLNRGCIPTKAMVRDAELYRDVTSGAYGIAVEGAIRPDFPRMMRRKSEVVTGLVEGVERLMASHRIDVYPGLGRLARPDRVEVIGAGGTTALDARAVILATGSVPARVPIVGADLDGVITSDQLLELETLPKRLVVIGGSVVGIEFACIFSALGTEVTVLGRKSFLKEAEGQLAKRLQSILRRRGISITIGLDFERIVRRDDHTLVVEYTRGGKPGSAEGDHVLLSTGRWPYTADLGLEKLGVTMDERSIAVDSHLRTNLPGVYAIGDCIGGQMLAHVASYEGEVAVYNIMGRDTEADYRVVPNCIFAMPEIAGVGLTEDQAKDEGIDFTVSRFPFSVSGRAVAMGEPEGQVRMICERAGEPSRGGGRVLGVHIMGVHASDLIAEAALAIKLNATARDLAETVHAHPTVPEALMEAAMAHVDGAIHYERL